jgi:4-hydroxy-tetrahydrodipicolinate synthase
MGEADKLLTDERVRVIETYIGAANGRIPIVVGTTHAGTQPAVALARQAEKLGAAGLMIAPPPVTGADACDQIKAHYQAINDAVSIPIVVQDYPISNGVILSPELLAEMARSMERVQYLKLEDPPTPVKLQRVRQQAGDRLGVMGGLGGMFYFEELEQGALGTMTGFAFPEILVEIYQAHRSGNVMSAASVFYHCLPLIRFEFQPGIGVAIRKELFRRRGAIKSATTRAPAIALDETTGRELTSRTAGQRRRASRHLR